LGALFGTACGAAAEGGSAIVLHNGSVFTATGDEPIRNAAVVVQNGMISAVGPEGEIEFPRGATLIDVEERTILPGLIDAHTHILEKLVIQDGEFNAASLEIHLRRPLAVGLTTVRDVGSPWNSAEAVAELREVLDGYGNALPTVIMTGPILAHADGPVVRTFSGQAYGVTTAGEAREAARVLAEADVDQIKIALHMRPIMAPPRGDPPEEIAPSLNLEQVQGIVDVSREHDLWVTAHVADPREAYIALEGGVDELAHWPATTEALPDDLLEILAARGVPVVSTWVIVPPQEGDARRFLDAGGTLVFGTDSPGTGALANPWREFRIMSLHDMTPAEMISSATANAAQAIGLGDVVGTLEVGKQADIIVVDGDPFEDIQVIRDVLYVIKGGELVVQPEAEDEG
jgi:imidazolonepropionase-like amidohydrolase